MPPTQPAAAGRTAVIPPLLFNACFVMGCINLSLLLSAYVGNWWIYDAEGRGIPTDFVNVWAAGRLALTGHPAQAWDWDIQKQVELAVLGQDFVGYFAWHYPPPFLFVAQLLACLPYGVAFVGWSAISVLPYLATMRAIVARAGFGLMVAVALPPFVINTTVGQNGFLTAALIGGTLYLLPSRPWLAGICLGLLSYKPQYGLLFPLALAASGHWRAFASAGMTTVGVAAASWLAFGTESWQAFVHWMPMFSQAFLTEGKAPWWKLQSVFAMVRYAGGSEYLGWVCHWIFVAAVAVTVIMIWRSHVRYTMKAAALALGALLTTPYLFMYDMMVLAIPVGFLVRAGLATGFRPFEIEALGLAFVLLLSFMFFGLPVGLIANLIVAGLILQRCGPWWRRERRSLALRPQNV